jgi:Asp-tRNA(Asn)/Glu-tRNA(Gln) amidotransferase A subunit family amidase
VDQIQAGGAAVTLIGRLFDEGTVARAGLAMERALAVSNERPAGF